MRRECVHSMNWKHKAIRLFVLRSNVVVVFALNRF